MSYTITIQSETKNVRESETVQLKIIFTVNDTGSNIVWNTYDKGIRVLDWGSAEWRYDIEDPLLTVGNYEIKLGDMDSVLRELFFYDTSLGLATDKRPELKVFVNGNEDYSGKVIEEGGVNFSAGNKIVELKANSVGESLSSGIIDGESPCVLGYTDTETTADYKSVITILEDIFSYIGNTYSVSGGSLELTQDWVFKGTQLGVGTLEDIEFSELRLWIDALFFNADNGINNLSDLIKQMAIEWGCFAGIINSEKAFFKKLFYYDASNTQTLEVDDFTIANKFSRLEYVEVIVDTDFKTSSPAPKIYTHDDRGQQLRDIPDQLKINALNGFYYVDSGDNGSNVFAEIARGGAEDGTYIVYYCKDPNVTVKVSGVTEIWSPSGRLLSRYWYKWRGKDAATGITPSYYSRQNYIFDCRGITYSILKSIPYSGYKHQPIRLKKMYGIGKSEIETVLLGPI